jgi:hypothetical protein
MENHQRGVGSLTTIERSQKYENRWGTKKIDNYLVISNCAVDFIRTIENSEKGLEQGKWNSFLPQGKMFHYSQFIQLDRILWKLTGSCVFQHFHMMHT